MTKFISKNRYLFLIVIINILAFWGIWETFYQQDEWQGLGNAFVTKSFSDLFTTVGLVPNFASVFFGEGRTFSSMLGYFLFGKFPLDITHLAIFSLGFHILNALLLFKLTKLIFQKDLIAFTASLFFSINLFSPGTVVWFGTSIGTLPAVSLILYSLINYFYYIKDGKQKKLLISFISLYLSLHFKEIGIYLFLLLPLGLVFFKKFDIYSVIKPSWYFIVFCFFVVLYRIYKLKSTDHEVALFVTGVSKDFMGSLISRILLYPLTSITLIYLPPKETLDFAKYLTNLYYPFIDSNVFNLFAQTAVLDLISIFTTSILFLVLIIILVKKNRETKTKVIFLVLLLGLSYVPYAVISKSYSYLEPRYYYLASAFSGILLGFILVEIIQRFKNKLLTSAILGLLILYMLFQYSSTKSEIQRQIEVSSERKNVISQLTGFVPNLTSKKNVFVISGDGDYYVTNNRLPFQQGMGFTLMMIYFRRGQIPENFVKNKYLWDLNSQGYKEDGDLGFGYFWNPEDFKKLTQSENINVISLFYDSKTGELKRRNND